MSTQVEAFQGRPIRGCNDCAFDSEGNLYFTAPAGSSRQNPVGEVYCCLASGEVRCLDTGYAFSNGLAVSVDDRLLIVAETFSKKLFMDTALGKPGEVEEKFLSRQTPGEHDGGRTDGLLTRKESSLQQTLERAHLEVFAIDGILKKRVPLPSSIHPMSISSVLVAALFHH